MTEQDHPRHTGRLSLPTTPARTEPTLPDLDSIERRSPVAPAADDAIQFERPLSWEPERAERESSPVDASPGEPVAPVVPTPTHRAGGSLPDWRYGADAWRLNRRLTRRHANLMLRVRTARALPSSLRARFTAMGLPEDVVDETLGSIRSLDAWPDAWIATAQRYLGDFRRQVSAGNKIDGARNQAMAGLCYHVAQIVSDPNDRRTTVMCRAAAASLFTHALPYVYPSATKVAVPWRAKALPGYLHVPLEHQAAGRYGLVVLLNGASSSKEETFTWATPFMRAGLAVLALDSPGTGEAARTPFAADQDDILDGVFDLLGADPRLDLGQVVVVGISLGGNQAIRCAAYDRRIAGVVAVTAPVEPGRWIGRISPLLGDELMAISGSNAENVLSLARDLDLREAFAHVTCPVLAVGAGRDVVVPPNESQRLTQSLGALATLDWFAQSGHCVYDQLGIWTADAARWATAVMAARAEAGNALRSDRIEQAQAVAASARDALLASPVLDERPQDDEFDEGARLLAADEVLDDDPDWYAPAAEEPARLRQIRD
ncbi:MAG TPA: alpha/beta fold hydrolase [Thermomicrobiales bacterium]|nr:alpha/beta fold hydrolase [Thermomicrobiales bacterium]